MPIVHKIHLTCLALFLLGGCSWQSPHSNRAVLAAVDEHLGNIDKPASGQSQVEPQQAVAPSPGGPVSNPAAEQISRGDGPLMGPIPTSAPPQESGSKSISLNFQDADIHEVVEVILGSMLKQNYIIDSGVSGTISTNTPKGIAQGDLLTVLESLLRINNAVLTREGALYRIVPGNKALTGTSGALFSQLGYSIDIIQLQYISTTEVQKILQPILSEGAVLYADEQRNLLMIAGTLAERRRYQQMVQMFDVDWMQGMSIGLFPLKYVEPRDLEIELNKILGGERDRLLNGLVRLVALERLNALLVVTASAPALAQVESWITRLDIASDQSAPRLFVYRLQNAKATDIADLLNDIFSGNNQTGSNNKQPELAPGTQPVTLTSPTPAAAVDPMLTTASATAPLASSGGAASGAQTGISVASVGENARIMADQTNNALVVLASPREYEIIESAIKKLDVIPLQVMIEATIVEVSLQDSLEYGVEWFFKHGAGSKSGIGRLDLGAVGLNATAPSFSFALTDGGGDVRAVINALATESQLTVLSSPNLMVLDNQTASINVGDEIPIPSRQSTSNLDSLAPTVNEIEYRSTGVTMTVTPRVNAGGLITMEIEQEVSDAVATSSSELNAPTIQQRKIATVVAIQSGSTVVLGGLIRTSKSVGDSGVPYVRKIPLLGKLFGQTTDSGRRTELLILITPRAINNDREAQAITREFRDKLRGLAGDNSFQVKY